MGTYTVRVSEKAYNWISKKSVSENGTKLSTPRLVDMLILNFDNTYDKYTITDESKEKKNRLSELQLEMERILEEKRALLIELEDFVKEEEGDGYNFFSDDDLFEEDETKRGDNKEMTPREKMMKTKIF